MSKVAHAHPVEDALRRSHCSHADRDRPDHRCVGTCTISPKGLTLDCVKCGGDYEPHHPAEKDAAQRAKEILRAAGIGWDSLSDETRARVCAEVLRTMCPGCGSEKPHTYSARDYHTCRCGAWSWSSCGWRRKDP